MADPNPTQVADAFISVLVRRTPMPTYAWAEVLAPSQRRSLLLLLDWMLRYAASTSARQRGLEEAKRSLLRPATSWSAPLRVARGRSSLAPSRAAAPGRGEEEGKGSGMSVVREEAGESDEEKDAGEEAEDGDGGDAVAQPVARRLELASLKTAAEKEASVEEGKAGAGGGDVARTGRGELVATSQRARTALGPLNYKALQRVRSDSALAGGGAAGGGLSLSLAVSPGGPGGPSTGDEETDRLVGAVQATTGASMPASSSTLSVAGERERGVRKREARHAEMVVRLFQRFLSELQQSAVLCEAVNEEFRHLVGALLAFHPRALSLLSVDVQAAAGEEALAAAAAAAAEEEHKMKRRGAHTPAAGRTESKKGRTIVLDQEEASPVGGAAAVRPQSRGSRAGSQDRLAHVGRGQGTLTLDGAAGLRSMWPAHLLGGGDDGVQMWRYGSDGAAVDVGQGAGVQLAARRLTFDNLVRRIVQFSRRLLGQQHQSQLVLVCQLLRSLLASVASLRGLHVAQRWMVRVGALSVLVELMGKVSSPTVYEELTDTMIALLAGGNRYVQAQLVHTLRQQGAEAWMSRVAHTLLAASAEAVGGRSSARRLVHGLLRMLQLMCEGHNLEAQQFLRAQSGRGRSVNMVAVVTKLFLAIHDSLHSAPAMHLAIQVLDTLVEMMQGPCRANQTALVRHKFVEAAASLLSMEARSSSGVLPAAKQADAALFGSWAYGQRDESFAALERLVFVKTALALVTLLEGRRDRVVHRRLASLLSPAMLLGIMTRTYTRFVRDHGLSYSEEAFMQRFKTAERRWARCSCERRRWRRRLTR